MSERSLTLLERETRPVPPCRLVSWLPWSQPNPSLIGHCSVAFNSGWIITNIPVFRRADGTLSAGSPSMPILDGTGRHKLDGTGKKQYAAVVTFEGAGRDLWNRTIIAALMAAGINPAGEAAP